MKRLSIIIVTYHSEKDIYDCIDSVRSFTDIPCEELEVIVVDNSPQCEPMFTKLRELYGNDIILIHNTHNGGYGQGNNVGIRKATAPVIMIMNPDVRLVQPVFRHCLEQFANQDNLVLYGFTQRQADGSIGRSTSWISTIHPYIAEPFRFVTGKMNLFFPKYMYVTGACFFLRKETFEQVGLFDEHIFMYGEEEDIHDRLLAIQGATMGYARHLSYLHLHEQPKDFEKETHDWMEHNLETLCYLHQKRGIPARKTIGWAIKRNNISIWKEKIKALLTNGANRERLKYYCLWKQKLESKLKSVRE
ncbi:MAG: glycosyltransferase [Prevotella sp.]|nr:glycosyltransferase [Prevotella sp.]